MASADTTNRWGKGREQLAKAAELAEGDKRKEQSQIGDNCSKETTKVEGHLVTNGEMGDR